MPKVSINIPCFNGERFIKETIESVLNQTFEDFEVIIMDDGSTDRTASIIKSFSDTRLKYFYKDNEGLAETRNKSVKLSRGEYIAFLDQDDLWLKDKMKRQMEIFDGNSDVGLVYSDAYVTINGRENRKTYFDICRPYRGLIFEKLLFETSNFIPLPTVIMRKSIFDDIGLFQREFVIGEELDLFLRVAEKYKFDYIDEPLAIYRIHPTNFSRNKEISVKEALEILQYWQDRKPHIFIKNQERFLKKQADMLAELANFYALNLRKERALYCFDLSLSKYKSKKYIIKKHILKFLGCYVYSLLNKIKLRLA